ncbi:MAG TPA: hypothetical protein EYP10_10710, partial [Armatimonadetes bacterium]|nr:hypothetical protein [Armatimonadota bacterium]
IPEVTVGGKLADAILTKFPLCYAGTTGATAEETSSQNQRQSEACHEPADVYFIEASGVRQEVEAIATLLCQLRSEGIAKRWCDIAVAFRNLDEYAPWLERTFNAFGIPFEWVGAPPPTFSGVVAWVLHWLVARIQEFDAESIWRVLPSPYLRKMPSDNARRELATIVRCNPTLRGADKWLQLLEEHLGADAIIWCELLKSLASLPQNASLREYADALLHLIIKFVRIPALGDTAIWRGDAHALDVLLGWLKRLEQSKSASEVEVSITDFHAEMIHALSQSTFSAVPSRGDAVCVGTAGALRGCIADVVVIGGLNEGVFPIIPPASELLRDEERRKLESCNHQSLPLRYRSRRLADERLLFALLIGGARKVLVLTHRATDEDGKPQVSSPFWEDAKLCMDALNLRKCTKSYTVADVHPRSFDETWTLRRANALAFAIAFHDEELEEATSLRDLARAHVIKQLSESPLLFDNMRTEYKRYAAPQEGFWDGLWDASTCGAMPRGDFAQKACFAQMVWSALRNEAIGVTALEDYAQCPFRFFAKHVLKLREPEALDATVRPADWGILWHEILQVFHRKYRMEKSINEAFNGDMEKFREALKCVAQCIVENFRKQGKLGDENVWQAAQTD